MRRWTAGAPVRIALVPWGTPIEVFLDPIGKTLDDFCERLSGGWLFGYVEALQLAGHQPAIVLSSRTVRERTTRAHAATGAPVVVLPAQRRRTRADTSATPDPAPPPAPPHEPGLRRDLAAYRHALPPGLMRALGRFDAVLVQEYEEPRADLLAWWGRLRGVSMMASFQGGIPPWEAAPVQDFLRPRSLRQYAGLLAGSSAEVERLVSARGADPSRVHRVVNPVDTTGWVPGDRSAARLRLGIPPDSFVVAWHGRVEMWRKGLDVLVDAWAEVCAAQPDADVRLLLAGTGADEEQLRTRLRATPVRGVDWRSEYAGAADVRERLAACDVWVSPSRLEGFAVAPLEAMASGRAVVLSNAPGVEDVIGLRGAHGGVVVPCGDTPALASALLDAFDDAAQLDDRGLRARRHVEQHFSVGAVSRQLHEAVMASMLVSRNPLRSGRH